MATVPAPSIYDTPLCEAAVGVTGRVVFVASLIAVCATFRALGATSASRLIEAAKTGNAEAVRSLVAQHVNVNAPEIDGTTALDWAVRESNAPIVDLLIRSGANVNASNRYGVTPLWLAASNGDAATIDVLLNAGANAKVTRDGETALMMAARTGRPDAVRILLAHGADVKAKEDSFGETALMLAAAESHAAAVQMLIESGADVNAQTRVFDGEPKRDRTAVALQPLNTTFPRGGFTALMFAARQGTLDVTRALIAAGADVNLQDPDGIGALVIAIINGHYDVASALIDGGADVNAVEPGGRTPLWAAVDMHTLEYTLNRPPPAWNDTIDSLAVVKRLLDHGADPNVTLTQPVKPRKVNVTNPPLLGAGATPLLRAATHADVAVLRLLLAKGADPNLATRAHTTALMLAAGLGWRDLYSGGSEADAIEFVRTCLERGADVNAVNDQGNTALHGAAQREAPALIGFLVAHGARLDVKNKRGLTPLGEALGFAPVREKAAARLRELMLEKGVAPVSVHPTNPE